MQRPVLVDRARHRGLWRSLLVAALSLSGCGLVIIGPSSDPRDDPDGGARDGDGDGRPLSEPDGGAGVGRFGPPRLIEALAAPGANDDDPTVTGDRLELYFNSDRAGGSDLYVSVRASLDDPWGEPDPVAGVNTAASETAPEVASDGLTLWFSSNRSGGKGGQDIWVTTRDQRGDPWGSPELVPELNSTAADYSPVMDGSGSMVLFFSTRDGGDNDLFMATRESGDDPWQAPVPVAELNTAESEADPFLAGDGLTLYFGAGPNGRLDVFATSRSDRDGPFDPPARVDELNGDGHDADPWLSADGSYLLFTSNRGGDNDVYEAVR